MGAGPSCSGDAGGAGGRRMSLRAHALCNPLSTKKRAARSLGGEGLHLLPDALLVYVASFSVSPHAVDWRTLLTLRAVSVLLRAALVCEDAPPLWCRIVRPPTDAALLLAARGAGFGGPTHVDLSGCAALTDAALLAALHGGSRLRVLNVSGHFYGEELLADEGFEPPEPPFTPSAVGAVLASLAQPDGQPCHTPLHLITNKSERWAEVRSAADERSSACRTELGAPCQACQIDMLEERGPGWGPCDMCNKHVCGAYGERSEDCTPTRTCTVCEGTFCAGCDARHAPNGGWGHHFCGGCCEFACRSCVQWPSCEECGEAACLACDSGDYVICTTCDSMWCAACAEDKDVHTCESCDSTWCGGCGETHSESCPLRACKECGEAACLACDSGDVVISACTACDSMWCAACAEDKDVHICESCGSGVEKH